MRMFGEKLNLVKFLSGVAVAALVSMPAVAAVTCDDDDALINPALALCSTHVYNVGGDKNPSDGADRVMMREVVALKTTVMTQQMYKQYEYLESMIRRFKTQLEKAVLKTRLQTSGAGDDSSSSGGSSSYRSEDRNVHLAGVQNCLNIYQDAAKLKCYEDNLNVIINTSNHGNKVDNNIKKQLVYDFKYLAKLKFLDSNGCEVDKECENEKMSKTDFGNCLNSMRSCLSNQYRAYNNQQVKLQQK